MISFSNNAFLGIKFEPFYNLNFHPLALICASFPFFSSDEKINLKIYQRSMGTYGSHLILTTLYWEINLNTRCLLLGYCALVKDSSKWIFQEPCINYNLDNICLNSVPC